MKLLADLTIEDLAASPVWRYVAGNGAEAVVTADHRDSLSQSEDEVFLAATNFLLPDSSQHAGFCFPVDAGGVDYLQPVIVTPSGHVRFWFDGVAAREVLAAQWSALGRREEEIFPVRFRCRIPVDGRTVDGVISSVETSADITPVHPAELAAPSEEKSGTVHGSPGSGGRVPASRPARARRGAASRAGTSNKRTSPRHNVELMVDFDQGGSRGSGVTGNLSRSGIFVRSPRPARSGPAVSLTVHLPGGRELLLKGWVVRSASPSSLSRSPGFGFALTEKSDDYERFLSQLFDASK